MVVSGRKICDRGALIGMNCGSILKIFYDAVVLIVFRL
jgi:hypothetical protein